MSVTPESLANLTPKERRELLERLLRERAGGRKTYPLSFAQGRLWILDRLAPGNPTYNVPLVMRLPGPLDVDALERSLREIVRRHETLRTTFEVEDKNPVQVVAPSSELKLNFKDLSRLPQSERDAEAQRISFEESTHSFDLAHGPLVRVTLVKLSEVDHLFVLVMHHIISDGWSIKVFYQELSTLYLAYHRGQPSPLPELPLQYGDFARWQAEWFTGEVLERQLTYWSEQLAGLPALIELPTDRPRPPVQTHRGSLHAFSLEKRLHDDINALSRREGVTLFMTLLAAFDVLLGRYAGRDDVAVGTPIANRTRVELEGLIGFFVNTLVLRTDLSGDPTFRELLGRVREVTLGAYAHQDMPFERLVEELQPERNLAHNPLFQVMFTLQNVVPTTRGGSVGSGTAVPVADTPPVVNGTAKFDLTLVMGETGQGLQGMMEYNTDLFDPATVERMAERFRTLLRWVVSDPDLPISRLPLLGDAERGELIARWRGAVADEPGERTLHAAVAAHARRTPDAPAVSSDTDTLTYGQLEARADTLARRLRAEGVAPGAAVAVCVEGLAETLVAALGIWKAGGICVPLDPADPPARASLMLEDAGASLVVCDERHAERLAGGPARVLRLGGEGEGLSAGSDGEPAAPDVADGGADADTLACLLYESGAEGVPEGVMVTHRALCRTAYDEDVRLTSSDSFAHFPGHSGSGAFFDLCAALSAGARLVAVPGQTPAPPRRLAALLRDQGVTALSAPASILERLAREFPWALKTLRLIFCDDRATALRRLREVIEPDALERVYARYGPAEAGGCGAIRPLAEKDDPVAATLGRPAAGAKLYLLDSAHEPVPDDLPGEIYVGSESLAHGYHGRLTLTAETFLPDPYSPAPGARLYRTGDVARSRPDGTLIYLRRHDRRFVARGRRVEPREIEAALAGHPAVRDSAVVAREAASARELDIVALYVAEGGSAPSAEDLRVFLRERLPEWMLPTSFNAVETLPRDARGELDARALTELAAALDSSAAAPPYAPPRNDIERRLADLWADSFGVERVGIHDSFFRLGGHSLLATQVVARIGDLFKIDLPLGRLFETPTIAELARVVEQLSAAGSQVKLPPITRAARRGVKLPAEGEPRG